MPCTDHLDECMSAKPHETVLWKHKLSLFSSRAFFMLLIMPSMKTTLLEELVSDKRK
jgi:hypothetical protein